MTSGALPNPVFVPPAPRRPGAVPVWLSVLAILASVACSAWMVRVYLRGRGGEPVATLPQERGVQDGVRKFSAERWRIAAGPAAVMVNKRRGSWRSGAAGGGGGGELDCQFYFERYEFLTPEQLQTLTQVRLLANNPSLGRRLDLTPEQAAALREIRAAAKIEMADEDVREIRRLFPVYERVESAARLAAIEAQRAEAAVKRAAPGADLYAARARAQATTKESERLETERINAELPLIKATARAAEHVYEPARKSAVERAAKARAVLTEAQWKQVPKLPQR